MASLLGTWRGRCPAPAEPPNHLEMTPLAAPLRYIVEAPPNICTPTHMASAAEAIAAAAPDVFSCTILEQADCEAMRMGCYLGVTACSAEPPKFIHMTYKPSGGPPDA